jgi:hypothetical protein
MGLLARFGLRAERWPSSPQTKFSELWQKATKSKALQFQRAMDMKEIMRLEVIIERSV